MSSKAVGFVGVGRMGSRMARNVLRAGFPVRVFDLSEAALEAMTAAGAVPADSPAEVAAASDVIITVLQSAEAVEAAYLGSGGIAEGIRPGAIAIDASTVSPTLARRVAGRIEEVGASFLDCPVSGGPPGAEKGTLTILAGGSAEALERCRDVLAPMSGAVHHLGPVGSGLTGKLVNQLLIMSHCVLALEALSLGAKAGMDLKVLYDLVSRSSGNSWAWQNRVPRYLYRPDDIWSTLDICHKDLMHATELAKELHVPVFTAQAAFQVMQMGKAKELGEEDLAALATVYEELLGISLRVPAGEES
jgi:3-hydroxyisobutyrate dehydrogenase-like beta-hydroxyacid dehydrogenase